ncbi:hypothetical protein CCYA_CCYA11G2995 [Cyanidiococcus yangmingshanensis]|nr:hypothetical protein CCYA_CCYA11G2995 [Cyanidiococcus yangmingshanensis]
MFLGTPLDSVLRRVRLRSRVPVEASRGTRLQWLASCGPLQLQNSLSPFTGQEQAFPIVTKRETHTLHGRTTGVPNRLKEEEGACFVDFLRKAVEHCWRNVQAGKKGTEDLVWERIRMEAAAAAREEQLLASFLYATVLNHDTLEACLAFHLANKLASTTLPSTMLNEIIRDALETAPDACYAIRLDLLAVADRDPACTRVIDALLFFKGFHALQAHRVAHWLWKQGRYALALYLHSQVCKVLQIDIHPAAKIGYGVFMDHGTGVVIGETARVGNNVSMLHHVTLGGTGTKLGDRHPKIEDGVLIGAGATILGNVTVGRGAMVGACTVLTNDLPPHSTAVGVPARIVGAPRTESPAFEMDQDPTHCRKRRTESTHADGLNPKAEPISPEYGPTLSNGQAPTP